MQTLRKRTKRQNFSSYTNTDKGQLYFSEYTFYHFITSSFSKIKRMLLGPPTFKSQVPVQQLMKKVTHYRPTQIKIRLPQSFNDNAKMIRSGLEPYILSERRWGIQQKRDKQERQNIIDHALERRRYQLIDQSIKQLQGRRKKIKTNVVSQQFWQRISVKQEKLIQDLKKYMDEQNQNEKLKQYILKQAQLKQKSKYNQIQKIREQKIELVNSLIKLTQNDPLISPIHTQSSAAELSDRSIAICIQNIAEANQQRQKHHSQSFLQQKQKEGDLLDQGEQSSKGRELLRQDEALGNNVLNDRKDVSDVDKQSGDDKLEIKIENIVNNPFIVEAKSNAKVINLMDIISKQPKSQNSPFTFSSSPFTAHVSNQPSFNSAPFTSSIPQTNHDRNLHYQSSSHNLYHNTQVPSFSSNPLYQQPKKSMFQQFHKPQHQQTTSQYSSTTSYGTQLNGHRTLLNANGNLLNGHRIQLNGHGAHLNGHGAHLNGIETQLNDHMAQLNGDGTQINGHRHKQAPKISYLDNFTNDVKDGSFLFGTGHFASNSRLFDDDSSKKTEKKYTVAQGRRRGKQKDIRISG